MRPPVVMYGSKFTEDKTEEYIYRILSKIILYMESGRTLILKDLEDIYGSLYGKFYLQVLVLWFFYLCNLIRYAKPELRGCGSKE